MRNIILSIFVLGGLLSSCRKPPQKIEIETITTIDSTRIPRVDIQIPILYPPDSTDIEKIIAPIKDTVTKKIIAKNIRSYLHRAVPHDTTIKVDDVELSLYKDNRGVFHAKASRAARVDVKKNTIQKAKVTSQNTPYYKSAVFWSIALGLAITILLLYITNQKRK